MEKLNSKIMQKRMERVVIDNEMTAGGFAALPYVVMLDKKLSVGARLTYAFLLRYGWQKEAFAGQQKMAQDIGLSVRQVQRFLYELRDRGYIEINRPDRRYGNVYVVLQNRVPSKLKARKKL